MNQQALFPIDYDSPATGDSTPPLAPFVSASQTSYQAAERILPHRGRMLAQVLEFVRDRGDLGATDEEIREGTGLKADTSRARRCEARDAGLLVDSGRRRLTTSGRAAVAWVSIDAPGGCPAAGEKNLGRSRAFLSRAGVAGHLRPARPILTAGQDS